MANSSGGSSGAAKKTAASRDSGGSQGSNDSRNSGGSQGSNDPGANLSDALQETHDSRVTLQDESVLATQEDVVDARLDNREGADRPRRVEFPAVPQQVDGPDVAHQAEFTRRYLQNKESEPVKDALGMASPGPHGLSDLDQRAGKDRADESGGEAAPNGEEGSPIVGKPEALGSQRP